MAMWNYNLSNCPGITLVGILHNHEQNHWVPCGGLGLDSGAITMGMCLTSLILTWDKADIFLPGHIYFTLTIVEPLSDSTCMYPLVLLLPVSAPVQYSLLLCFLCSSGTVCLYHLSCGQLRYTETQIFWNKAGTFYLWTFNLWILMLAYTHFNLQTCRLK